MIQSRDFSLVVAVGALLLVAPVAASAECAWVLWSDLQLVSKGSSSREWQIGTAVQSRAECHALMQADIKARRARSPKDNAIEKLSGGDTVVSRAGDTTFIRRYVCLPDTIDPRAPKAGR